MKKPLLILALAFALTWNAAAQSKGPLPDRVYIDTRTQEDIAMKDVAEGRLDLFFWGVNGPTYKALPKEVRDKLEVYAIPSGTWSFVLNPVPNQAPYTVSTKEGKTCFNPFAIREVRFALNFLINRKYIVDEILGGDGAPMYTAMTPGQPGTYRYNLIATRLGFTPEGSEKRALADIAAAMDKAAALPENKGKLVKKGQWWTYDGEPLSLKFLIRVDDPNGRLKSGRYIADQVEKAGLKVERLEYDRKKCGNIVWDSDPADYGWHLYTEGYSAGATRAYWDVTLAQMYAPYYGNMPGWTVPEWWNYTNEEIDALSKKIYNGNFLTEAEYWQDNLRATELGILDAARVNVAMQIDYFVANKGRFNRRMVYGVGDGLNNWSVTTADVKPDPKTKERIFRYTLFSAKGGFNMFPWDPIGQDGCQDSYSLNVLQPTCDQVTFESPSSALDTAWRVTWKNVQTRVRLGKADKGADKLIGELPVPETALLYNTATKRWEPVGPGKTSFSTGTYTYNLGKWHNGQPMRTADLLYVFAFICEWMTKDGEEDPYYDATYETSARPRLEPTKGIAVNKDGTLSTWFDFNFPLSKERVAAAGALPYIANAAGGVPVCVSWDIMETLAKMVAEGGKSGTNWGFISDDTHTQVDLINPSCIADVKAKLEEMKAGQYVPAAIRSWVSANEAVSMYDASLRFIEEHGHAWISNGPFYIERYDPQASFFELRAVRDSSYPFSPDFWPKYFLTRRTRIDGLTVPSVAARDKDTRISVKVSEVEYPADTAKAASAAGVKATLIGEKEKVYTGRLVKAGEFEVLIPAADLKALKPGSYTLVVESVLGKEAPAVESTTLIVF